MTTIGVVIPVGPERQHRAWLLECMESVTAQTLRPDKIIVVDDMAGIRPFGGIEVWRPPWRLGVTNVFNAGVALAHQGDCDLALMLGADDTITPDCLHRIVETYEENDRAEGYYWLDVTHSDDRPDLLTPCNAAAITAGVMRATGGFPPEAGTAPDMALIGIMRAHFPEFLVHVEGGPYYVWRMHPDQESARGQPGHEAVREWLIERFKRPEWGRYGA